MSSPSWQKAKFKWKINSKEVNKWICTDAFKIRQLKIHCTYGCCKTFPLTVGLQWAYCEWLPLSSVGETPVTSMPHTPYLPKKPCGTDPMKKHCVFLPSCLLQLRGNEILQWAQSSCEGEVLRAAMAGEKAEQKQRKPKERDRRKSKGLCRNSGGGKGVRALSMGDPDYNPVHASSHLGSKAVK